VTTVAPQPVLDRLWGRRYISTYRPDTVSSPDGSGLWQLCSIIWERSHDMALQVSAISTTAPAEHRARDLHGDYSGTQGGSCTQ